MKVRKKITMKEIKTSRNRMRMLIIRSHQKTDKKETRDIQRRTSLNRPL